MNLFMNLLIYLLIYLLILIYSCPDDVAIANTDIYGDW